MTAKCSPSASSLPDVPFGAVKCDAEKVFRKGDTCSVECKAGYRHNNDINIVTCGNFGKWDDTASHCGKW